MLIALLALLPTAWAPPAAEPVPFRHTLFLQFEGASLSWVPAVAEENAALGLSVLSKFEGSEIPAYDGTEQDRLAVRQAVQNHLAQFGVRVVDVRPNEWVPYTMAVVGGSWDDTAATSVVRGVAPVVDCQRENPRHTVFAFVSAAEPTVQQATTISQEAGHAWGLDHVVGDGLIMSSDFAALSSSFSDGCVPLCEVECEGEGTVYCHDVHEQFCPAQMQDSVAELLYTFGAATEDTEAPTVTFAAPTEGAVLPPMSDLTVEIEVTDDFGGVGWRFELDLDGEVVAAQTAFARELTWPLGALPIGQYEVRVLAEDHADHLTTATVHFAVAEAAADSSSDGAAGDTDAPTGAAEMPVDDSGDDETTVAAGEDGAGDDCACRSSASPPPWAWLIVVLGSARRRRLRGVRTSPSRSSSCRS